MTGSIQGLRRRPARPLQACSGRSYDAAMSARISDARPFLASLLLVSAALLPLFAAAGDAAAPASGLRDDLVFNDYTPLSGGSELIRRILSPLNALNLQRQLARSGQSMREQSIDLAQERFVAYVPSGAAPPQGYALLVFVPPWQDAAVPDGWARVLDHHGMIFVSAAKSGNDENILDRRMPLALLAAHNMMRRYTVDPQRLYVGGFSGGSRVALRLALAYPDLFRGALLNSGSDPAGDAQLALPPRELFLRWQDSMRLVYLSGDRDEVNLGKDADSQQSLRQWCVFDLDTEPMPWAGHEPASAAALNHALDALDKHSAPDADQLAACRARIEQELSTQLRQVEDLLANNKPDQAKALLYRIDLRYGGLAAPRSVELARKIETPP